MMPARLAGVRARSTLTAVVVVALALAAGAGLLVVLLQRALLGNISAAATARASEVAALVHSVGDLPVQLSEEMEDGNRTGQVVQVVDDRGTVIAASTRRADGAPLSSARPPLGAVEQRQVESLPALQGEEPYLVTARGAADRGGAAYTVVVVASTEGVRQGVSTVLTYLLLGLPLLVLLVAAATWVLLGRALAPVERIRAQVDSIGAARLADRVPVPTSGDEIARLAVTMNQMLDRLERAHLAQRGFVSDASHELRSPLSTLTTALEVAGHDRTRASWPDLHEVMEAEADRMRRLVDDLLLLAKADDHGLRLHDGDVDLDDVLDAEVRRLRASSSVQVQAAVTPVRVTGDAAKLSQVVRNLADNAAREARSTVRFTLSRAGDTALITVEDDGRGIPLSDRERVLDRFVRLDESRARGHGGSGLGLAIVAEVVRAHAGTVIVSESALGGAMLEVRLPAVSGQPPFSASR